MANKSQIHWVVEAQTKRISEKPGLKPKRELIRSTFSPKRRMATFAFVDALRKNGFHDMDWGKAQAAPWFARVRKVNVEFLN